MFWLTNLFYDMVNESDDCLVHIMTFIDCLDHLLFRNLICTSFDHDDFLSGRCNGKL